MASFFEHIKRGVRMAYVYHIAGMDWAACSDPDMTLYLDSASGDALTLRRKLFGEYGTGNVSEPYSAAYVQIVCALDPNLGSQVVQSSREGGIDVGSWSVNIAGAAGRYKFGYRFNSYTALDSWCSGLTGLDWQPQTTISGIKFGVMSRDLRVDRDPDSASKFTAVLYWSQYRNYGLKKYIDDNNNTNTTPVFLWVGSSCLATNGAVTTDGDDYKVTVYAGQFNTPLEDLFYNAGVQYQISTAPIDLAGRTARLFAIPFDVVEAITP